MQLLLGQDPLTVIGGVPNRRPTIFQPALEQVDSGSILIVAESSPDTAADRLPGLLRKCHLSLPTDGRIALLGGNGVQKRITSTWSLMPGHRTTKAARLNGYKLNLSAMLKVVREAGFVNMAAFAVSPSAENPVEIRPLSRWDAWLAPAFLVTASSGEANAAFLLERIVQAVDPTQPFDPNARPARIQSVINSSRGKSIALVQRGESRIVVRLARSAVMLEDETRSYDVLQQLQTNRAVADRVPRPLGTGAFGRISYFAQSHLRGIPLSTKISRSNRAAYLGEVNRFLRNLNPGLNESTVVSFDDQVVASSIQPMIQFALQHVSDPALKQKANHLLADLLRGATGSFGIVHGDLGTGNILVEGNLITGVIDWEAARRLGPPVLDAFNYLDSAHRSCNRGLSIVDTLPMLASGNWPLPDEAGFLRDFFRYCGVDLRFQRGLALLYAIFHFGPQLRFANTEEGPKRRLEQVLQRFLLK